ncbi:Transposase [Shigella dysenteriae 1617]|uniref:Transposase n=1 Tax=Shigella dysenteriae 1617 TaxID=754093 RepID=A0A0A6ZRZ1_SHIDY|nr:Transposase [Shigella dysenteriae 1617]
MRSPNTCATTVFRSLSYDVKQQPALARFSPDVSPLFVHFRADDDVTARLYRATVTDDCGLSFFLSDVKSC